MEVYVQLRSLCKFSIVHWHTEMIAMSEQNVNNNFLWMAELENFYFLILKNGFHLHFFYIQK